MNAAPLAAMNALLTLSPGVPNRNGNMILTYAEVVSQLLRRDATDAAIVKVDEEICTFRKLLSTPCDFSQML